MKEISSAYNQKLPLASTGETVESFLIDNDDSESERFSRFNLIQWWDQNRLSSAKVIVVGAGALGNEIIKNLSLLCIGNLHIIDFDKIEHSNLSRSVLYREADNGSSKSSTAALAAKDIYPKANVESIDADIVFDIGAGVFRWCDLVICGLDNREARLAINRQCFLFQKVWIDGAIESIQGIARVFQSNGPCYECTMSQKDWELIKLRRSCNLLKKEEMEGGKTPTTPTISAIIAGVQCQEAIKVLHGLSSIAGKGYVFNGLSCDSYMVEYQRKEDCFRHDPLEIVCPLDSRSDNTTINDLIARAKEDLGSDAVLELSRDIVEKFYCSTCGKEEFIFKSLGLVTEKAAICPSCANPKRDYSTFCTLYGDEHFLDYSFFNIGIPRFDIVIGRSSRSVVGYEFSGDEEFVLGRLSSAYRGHK